METAEVIRQIERATGEFPSAAVEEAVARREEITPELLRILEDTVDRAAQLSGEDEYDYTAHLYAMFLLAQFRETRAYPLLVRFALLPSEYLDPLAGDFITDNLSQVFASVCGGDLGGIQSVVENEAADEWARSAALDSLLTLVVVGQKSRAEIVSYFASLFRGKLVREWSQIWNTLVSSSSSLYPAELFDDIRQAYEDDLVDPSFISLENVESDLAAGEDRVLAKLKAEHFRHLIDDTEKEMGWWDCFQDDGADDTIRDPLLANLRNLVPAPFRRPEPKTGRNEPCPCGSGKKYKKCCGR